MIQIGLRSYALDVPKLKMKIAKDILFNNLHGLELTGAKVTNNTTDIDLSFNAR